MAERNPSLHFSLQYRPSDVVHVSLCLEARLGVCEGRSHSRLKGICIKKWENGRGLNTKEKCTIKGHSLNSTRFGTFPSWDPKYFFLLRAMVSHHKRNISTSTQKLKL